MKYFVEKIKSIKSEYVIILFCTCILLPLLVVGIYNRPSADDYDYALITYKAFQNSKGIESVFAVLVAAFQTTIHFYNTWQGLYTSAFLLSLHPGIFNEQLYGLSTTIIIGLLILYFCLSFLLVNRHSKVFQSKIHVLAFSLLITVCICLWLPSAVEGLYWFNGAMNYLPWAASNMLIMALIYDAYHLQGKKKLNRVVLAAILSFITSGANHVTAFANILFLLISNAYLLFNKKKYGLVPLAFAVFGFMIMYLAPGTAIRAGYFDSPSALTTIWDSLYHGREMIEKWMNVEWVCYLICITPICALFAERYRKYFAKCLPIFPLVISIGIICALFCVPYYAMYNFGAPRVTNVIWVTFMELSAFNYTWIIGWLFEKKIVDFKAIEIITERWTYTVVILLSLIFMVITPFTHTKNSTLSIAISELKSGIAQRYSAEMDERIRLYRDDEWKEIGVMPIVHQSRLLYFSDLSSQKGEWPNTSISEYYGKEIYLTYTEQILK